MPKPWTPLRDGEIALAHLSDLHFGSPKSEAVWRNVRQFLLGILNQDRGDALLVTGDLAHNPQKKLYETAAARLDELQMPYFVCAGNHDRHYLGNRAKWNPLNYIPGFAASAEFDKTFGSKVLVPQDPKEHTAGNGPDGWKIGLLGLDSSDDADWSARGFVGETHFGTIDRATRARDWDLCICFVHHHLLSIRALEHNRRGKPADLFKVTTLVNAGSLLEALTKANIDVVLHGHEHESNWARYGTFEPGWGSVQVLGAGSATGNDSATGCDLLRASFNVLILSPDRSVSLRKMRHDGADWKVWDEFPVLTAEQIRQARLRRAARPKDTGEPVELSSELIKSVEFTRERDIKVTWLFTNWLPPVNFRHYIKNATGVPCDVQVRFLARNGPPVDLDKVELVQADDDHAWWIKWTLPEPLRRQLVMMEISYCWRGGAVLTAAELEAVRRGGTPGLLRNDGYEFTSAFVADAVAAAELIVTLPPEYAPAIAEVIVQVVEDPSIARPQEAMALRQQVRFFAPGRFALRIKYPRRNCDYRLAWPPVKGSQSRAAKSFAEAARAHGNALLGAFAEPFKPTPYWNCSALSLYVEGEKPNLARRVGLLDLGSPVVDREQPHATQVLVGDRSALARAWCGIPMIVHDWPDASAALESGLLPGEKGIFCVPIRYGFGWVNQPPWAVVRLGLFLPSAAPFDWGEADGTLLRLIAAATTALLTKAFHEYNVIPE